MGNAAKLFYNPEDKQNTLAHRAKPSDEQVEEQRERWNDLADFLKDGLHSAFGLPVSSWLQGSYKFGTQIRPARTGEEFDIDLGVYVEWNGSAANGDVKPRALKEQVQAILDDYASDPTNDSIGTTEPKQRCNRICFANDFHIDVPSYHLDRSVDGRDLAAQSDTWEISDPKAIYVWWKKQHEGRKRDTARRLVRYLKLWAALTFEQASRPSSILLTVLVAQAFKICDTDELLGDDELFPILVAEIDNRLRTSTVVKNPVNEIENLNRLSGADNVVFMDELTRLLSIANRAVSADDEHECADIWAEAFKHFFPLPREDEKTLSKAAATSRNMLSNPRCDPDVQVIATSGKRRWEGMNGIGPIPKGCDIQFNIVNSLSFPEGATAHWIVRNEGADAEANNDLGHVAGTGLSNSEKSAYRGRHSMDVLVKLNGRIIGRRRVRVQVSGLGMPIRNPSRPAWTKLRKRG